MIVSEIMIRKVPFFYLLLLISLFLISCNNEDITPSFIYLEEDLLANVVDVSDFNARHETNYDSYQLEAIASHNFQGVWITVNTTEGRGCWGVPAKIPLLEDGTTSIKIEPAFMINGQSSQIPRYPFITGHTTNIDLEKGNTHTFSQGDIVFKYRDDIIFPLIDPFEQSTSFSSRIESGANIVIDNVDGNNVGVVTLVDSLTGFDLLSTAMNLTGAGNFIILEMDYKMSYTAIVEDPEFPEISVGIRYNNASTGVDSHHPIVNFRYSNDWNKVYINLSPIISLYASTNGVLTNVRVNLMGSMTENEFSEVKYYFDNVKIISY